MMAQRRLSVLPALLVGAAVIAYMAFATGASGAGVLVCILGALAIALALVGEAPPALATLGSAAIAALPGVLLVYFSFNGGGFFPATEGFVAALLAVALAVRIAIVRNPFAGFNRWLAVAAGALALYTGWTLLSALWSPGTARPLLEFNRALLYLLALVLVGSVQRTPERMRWMMRGVTVAAVAVSAVGLVTRLLPHTWPIAPNVGIERLSY